MLSALQPGPRLTKQVRNSQPFSRALYKYMNEPNEFFFSFLFLSGNKYIPQFKCIVNRHYLNCANNSKLKKRA